MLTLHLQRKLCFVIVIIPHFCDTIICKAFNQQPITWKSYTPDLKILFTIFDGFSNMDKSINIWTSQFFMYCYPIIMSSVCLSQHSVVLFEVLLLSINAPFPQYGFLVSLLLTSIVYLSKSSLSSSYFKNYSRTLWPPVHWLNHI